MSRRHMTARWALAFAAIILAAALPARSARAQYISVGQTPGNPYTGQSFVENVGYGGDQGGYQVCTGDPRYEDACEWITYNDQPYDNTLIVRWNSVDVTAQFTRYHDYSGCNYYPNGDWNCSEQYHATATLNVLLGTNYLYTQVTSPQGTPSSQATFTGVVSPVAVSSAGGTLSLAPSQTATVTFTVQNTGAFPTQLNAWSTCSGSGLASVCIVANNSLTLAAGQSANVNVNIQGSAAGGTGSVVLAVADVRALGSATGSATLNVSTTPPPPQVTVSYTGGSPALGPGQSSSVGFTVKNTGLVGAPVAYGVSCAGAGLVTSSCTVTGPTSLGIGQTGTATASFTTSAAGGPGTITIVVTNPSSGAQYGTASASINASSPPPAMSITSVGNPLLNAGQSGTAMFTVTNTGAVSGGIAYTVTCTGAGLVTSSCVVSSGPTTLTPGQSGNAVVTFTASAAGGSGAVAVVAKNPATGGAYGSATANVSVTPPPAQVALAAPAAATVPPDQAGTATFTVTNTGAVTAPISYSAACTGAGLVATPCTVASTAPASLAPSASGSVAVAFQSSPAGGSGTVTLTARNTTTNGQYAVSAAQLTVTLPPPKITLTSVAQITIVAAAVDTATFGVGNNGYVPATITYQVSCTGAGLMPSPCTLASGAPTSLQPGGNATAKVIIQGSNAGGSGSVQLTAINAATNAQYSTATTSVATTPPPPQLSVTAAAGPSLRTNQPGTVSFTVTNTGYSVASPTYQPGCFSPAGIWTPCTASGAPPSLAAGASATIVVSFTAPAAPITGTVSLHVVNPATGVAYASAQTPVTVAAMPTMTFDGVTPNPFPIQASQSRTVQVRARNTGTVPVDLTFTASCTGAGLANVCALSRTTITAFAPGDTATVGVGIKGADIGGTGSVVVKAFETANLATVLASRNSVVNVAAPAPLSIDVMTLHGGTTIERGFCPTVAIVADVASQCGALRITHGLPATTAFGKTYAPTLAYFSDHTLAPQMLVKVALNSQPVPDSVAINTYAVDAANNRTLLLAAKFGNAVWAQSDSQRFNTGLLWTDFGRATGIYTFDVEVQLKTAGAWTTQGSAQRGKVAWVNRDGSPFGNGWWLLGLEELYPNQPDDGVLWVGGDGSTRRYTAAITRGDTTVYGTPSLTRPDSLYRSNTTGWWRRALPERVNVYFDELGRHRQTVNTYGRTTTFAYDATAGRGRLQSITIPGNQQTTFTYASTGVTVTSPGGRVTQLAFSMQPNAISRITDPDLNYVGFQYFSGRADQGSRANLAISGRTDRRGTTTTFYWGGYTSALVIAQTPSDATHVVQQGFASPRGRAAYRATDQPVGAAQPSYEFDGPRTDVYDATKIWVDTLGAPRQVVDALGRVTTVARDAAFPGLVQSVVVPGGFEQRATYDPRGNLKTIVDVNPHDDGNDAITQYSWDQQWDALTRIVLPEGEGRTFFVDPATGLRQWEEPDAGGDHNRRVSYNYDPARRLMTSSKAPMSPRDSLVYDDNGNLAAYRSPRGLWSYHYRDAIGRDTLVRTPIDEPQTKWLERRVYYDLGGRDTLTTVSGVNAAGTTETQSTRTYYDRGGLTDSVVTWSSPDPAAVGRIRTAWKRDTLGRAWIAIAADGRKDTTIFDPAGNALEQRTRRGHSIVMTYDALNRLRQRTIPAIDYADTTVDGRIFPLIPNCGTNARHLCLPAEVSTYDFDPAGNMTVADNPDARVRRTYYRSGKIKTDSLYIRAWSGTTFPHEYGLKFGYDRNGRRRWLTYPHQLGATFSSAPAVVYDTLKYGYDPIFGQLSAVQDAITNVFQIASDSAGRLASILFPGGNYRSYGYDEDSRLSTLFFHRTAAGWDRQTTLVYDGRDKVLTTTQTGPLQCAAFVNGYSPAGVLVSSKRKTLCGASGRTDTESWTADPNGHIRSSSDSWESTNSDVSGGSGMSNVYIPGTDRVASGTTSNGSSQFSGPGGDGTGPWTKSNGTIANVYDAAGNVSFVRRAMSTQKTTVYSSSGWLVATNNYLAGAASYYDASNRLRVVDKWSNSSDLTPTAYEEYRYDALGRRILVRSRGGTVQSIQRFVWDGEHPIAEMQYYGGTDASAADLERDTTTITGADGRYWGRTLYTPGLAVDRPLDVIRIGYGLLSGGQYYGTGTTFEAWEPLAIAPDWDWRGESASETYYGPSPQCHAGAGNPSNHCVWITWPNQSAYGKVDNPNLNGWFGSLLQDQRDQTGQAYRRNRYYDPETGRFTQEDPIGIAGGLNVYGFAKGDPINYTDPFGLCPNPMAGGWGSLECVLRDFWTGAGQAAQAAVATARHNIRIGVSGTMGHYGMSYEEGLDLQRSVGHSLVLNVPQVGASVDFMFKRDAPAGAKTGSLDIGIGKHLGVSFNVSRDAEGAKRLEGVTVHLGTPSIIPTSPAGVSVDLPPIYQTPTPAPAPPPKRP